MSQLSEYNSIEKGLAFMSLGYVMYSCGISVSLAESETHREMRQDYMVNKGMNPRTAESIVKIPISEFTK